MTTSLSSHVKDKSSIFTARGEDIIFSKRKNPASISSLFSYNKYISIYHCLLNVFIEQNLLLSITDKVYVYQVFVCFLLYVYCRALKKKKLLLTIRQQATLAQLSSPTFSQAGIPGARKA